MSERKSVLITGASSGLGSAMASRMLELGWRVFGTSRKPRNKGDGDNQGDADRGVEWIAMDVCDDASVEAGLAAVFAATPRLDGLVCNAGFGIFGPVEETSLERARAQFETNVFGVLRVARPVLAHMRAQGAGRLLFVGSLAGRA
ncbi:SDR family NAD(P)-dependent oxidoreductase, partial [Myxococcota bacterium]|nr:SDR family NAD(P)-dependent oxidoreductase [Myxococcota bacterium]